MWKAVLLTFFCAQYVTSDKIECAKSVPVVFDTMEECEEQGKVYWVSSSVAIENLEKHWYFNVGYHCQPILAKGE